MLELHSYITSRALILINRLHAGSDTVHHRYKVYVAYGDANMKCCTLSVLRKGARKVLVDVNLSRV